jgi:hypothetical protein
MMDSQDYKKAKEKPVCQQPTSIINRNKTAEPSNLWPSSAMPKQATAFINPPYVLAAFTDIIFCEWHANIDKLLDDEDMQQSSLSNILQEVKMQQSIGGSRKLYATTIFFELTRYIRTIKLITFVLNDGDGALAAV